MTTSDKRQLLYEIFSNMSISGSVPTHLEPLQQIAGVKPASTRKDKRIEALIAFYMQDKLVEDIWVRLSAYEKDLLTCMVQSDYRATKEELEAVQKKHGVKPERRYYGYGENRFIPEKSKLHLLMPGGDTPDFIKERLARIIPPLKIHFSPAQVPDNYEELYFIIENRADCYAHFDMLLKFVNQEKVTATKAGGLMNKKALLNFHARTRHEDVFYGDANEMDEVRNIGETVVSYGMVKLLLNAKVLAIHADRYALGEKAAHFAGLDTVSKAVFLYETYRQHDNTFIDECQRIAAHRYQFPRSHYNLAPAVQTIAHYLSHCPVMAWVDISALYSLIRRMDHDFLRDCVGNPMVRDDYYNAYYETAAWGKLEPYFIDVVLMEYFGVLGMVDVLIDEDSDDYSTRSFPEVVYFRLTDLGAFLLGQTASYTPKTKVVTSDETGFIVQPNFDLLVPEGKQRVTHELFFDRFLTKTVSDERVSLFKLDFAGMARALDIGVSLTEIRTYLQTYATAPVPENVETAFDDWLAKSQRITIRTVTVLETDDAFLLEELKSYRNVKSLLGQQIQHAVVVDAKNVKKVKTAIEKNQRFVSLQ